MNQLAEATRDYIAAAEFSKPAAGLMLLQETMRITDGSAAKFATGMSTLGLAIANYDKTMENATSQQQKSQALMELSLNSLGALASSFSEGSVALL